MRAAKLTNPTLGLHNGPAHYASLSVERGHVSSCMVNREPGGENMTCATVGYLCNTGMWRTDRQR